MNRLSWIALAFFPVWLFAACSDTTEPVEAINNNIDCLQICETYSDCVEDIDVTSCTDECEALADEDETYEDAADQCEDCLDDKSCADATTCWNGCPVVPLQD